MSTLLSCENVHVNYGPVRALTGASFTLDGQAVGGKRAHRHRAGIVSYVPQSEEIDWTFPISVREVVSMGRYRNLGITRRLRAADRAAVDEALARVELTDLADRQIGRSRVVSVSAPSWHALSPRAPSCCCWMSLSPAWTSAARPC